MKYRTCGYRVYTGKRKGKPIPTPLFPNKPTSKSPQNARKHSVTITITECFLAGALGLEPRAYGFGGIPSRLIFHCTATTFLFYCTGDTNLTQGIIQHTVRHALWSLSPLPKNLHYRFPIQIHIHFFRTN